MIMKNLYIIVNVGILTDNIRDFGTNYKTVCRKFRYFKMKKRVLVVGTSHSQAVCQNKGQRNITFLDGRWFDYFEKKEYDVEVLNWRVVDVQQKNK